VVTKNTLQKLQLTHLLDLQLDIKVVELLDINPLLDRINNQLQHLHTRLMHSLDINLAQDLAHSLATSPAPLLISLLQQAHNTQKLDSLATNLALDLINLPQLHHHIRKMPSLVINLVLVHTNRLQHHQHSLKAHSLITHLVLGLTNLLP